MQESKDSDLSQAAQEETQTKVTLRQRMRDFWRRRRVRIVLWVLVILFFVVLLWEHVVIPINAGHQGVYFSRFGDGTQDKMLGEGWAAKLPWDKIHIYDIRLLHMHGEVTMLTSNGLTLFVDWSVRYRPQPDDLPLLHKTVGPDYAEKVIRPEINAAFRQTFGNFTPDQIYAADEAGLLAELAVLIRSQIEELPIMFNDILIKRLQLPEKVRDAIEEKLVREQELLAYKFRLKSEDNERERRTIEAEGIRAFEDISGVSILKWQGIQATVQLAQSSNSKIVVIGTDSKGLPLILNTEGGTTSLGASVPPGSSASLSSAAPETAEPIP